MESDIRTYLLTKADVTALVGTRIYLERAPQGAARPLIVYTLESDESVHTLVSYSGLTRDIIRFDCQDTTDVGSKALKETLRNRLDGYRGTMGSAFVASCIKTDESDDYTPPQDGSDKGIYHSMLDVAAWHSETQPAL